MLSFVPLLFIYIAEMLYQSCVYKILGMTVNSYGYINLIYILTRKGFLKYSIWRFVKLCNKRVPSIPFISFDCIMKGNSGKWNSFLSDLEKFSFLLFPFAIWSVWLVRSLNTHFSIWLLKKKKQINKS